VTADSVYIISKGSKTITAALQRIDNSVKKHSSQGRGLIVEFFISCANKEFVCWLHTKGI
jgi:hypothetical protein